MSDDAPILILKSSVYDALKFCTMVFFPGLGTLYFAIAQLWGLPLAEQVVGTISALVLFLGLILRQSSKNYQKAEVDVSGDLVFEQYPNGEISKMRVEARQDPFIVDENNLVKFKAIRQPVQEPDPRDP